MSAITMYQSISLMTSVSEDEGVTIDNNFSGDKKFSIMGVSDNRMYTSDDLRALRALISRALKEDEIHR